MIIAIDSSNQRMYSVAVSGMERDIEEFYKNLGYAFGKRGVRPPFHWSKISNKVKNAALASIGELVNDSKLKFNVFHHPKPLLAPKKDFFLTYVPNGIASAYEGWLKVMSGYVNMMFTYTPPTKVGGFPV